MVAQDSAGHGSSPTGAAQRARRGNLFYRLMQNAMAVEPAPYKNVIKGIRGFDRQNHNI
jgi:hypothetical protein